MTAESQKLLTYFWGRVAEKLYEKLKTLSVRRFVKLLARLVAMAVSDFTHQTHVLYFRDVLLRQLPCVYESSDPNRVTLAYFAVSALDLLNALDQVIGFLKFSNCPSRCSAGRYSAMYPRF